MNNEMLYVQALYEERNFSRAAKKLFISQPALSAAIRKLETELGVPLFERTTTTVVPTEACRYYIEQAKKIRVIENDMHEYFESMRDLDTGSLKIGTTTFYCCYSLPLYLDNFHEEHPHMEISLVENTSNTGLARSLHDGDLDLVLTSNPKGFEEFEKQLFLQEHLVLAVPASFEINQKLKNYALSADDILAGKHRTKECKAVSLKKFDSLPYISLSTHSDLYTRSMKIFHDAEIHPDMHMFVDQMPTSYYMTWHGYGFSIIRDSTLNIVPHEQTDEEPRIIYYKIRHPLAIRPVYLYYRTLAYQPPALHSFLQTLTETHIN